MFSLTRPGFLAHPFWVSPPAQPRTQWSGAQPAFPQLGARFSMGTPDRFVRGLSSARLTVRAARSPEDDSVLVRNAEKAHYIQLQKAAEQRRRSMPALFQLLYPLKGTVVGIKSTEMMVQDIALDPVLSDLQSKLTPVAEQKFLRQFAWLFSLSQDAKSGLASTAHQTLLQVQNPVLRDAMVAYLSGHTDPDVRRIAGSGVADMNDSAQRDALIQRLGEDSDWQNRAKAASMAELLSGDERRETFICKMLVDPNLEVRRMAARAVTLVQSPEVLSQLLPTMLKDVGWEIRLAAAENVYRLPEIKQRNSIRHQLLQDRSEQVRAVALGPRYAHIHHPKVMGALLMKPDELRDMSLVDLSYHPDATVRQQSALALNAIQDSTIRDEAIQRLIQDGMVTVRRAAIQALPLLSEAHSRDIHMASLVGDPDINTRILAAQLFSRIQDKSLREQTVKKLLSPKEHWMVRREALQQCLKLQEPAFVTNWLKRLTDDRDQEIRLLAVASAGQLSDLVTRDALLAACCKHQDVAVRKAATGLLPRMSNLALRERLIKQLIQDINPVEVQREAVRQLSLLEDSDNREVWIQKLVNSDKLPIRKLMVQAVAMVENQPLRDRLIVKLMNDSQEEVRQSATGLIELIHDPLLRDELLETAMQSDQAVIRQSATSLLPLLSNPRRRDALIVSSAGHDSVRVRQAAARLIPDISDERLQRECLQKLLQDPESTVRLLAVQALGVLVNESLQAISPDAYMRLFQQSFPLAFSQTESSPSRVFFPALLAALHPLRQSGLDGGELQKLLSEFENVTAHAVRRRETFINTSEAPKNERQIQNYLIDNLVPVLNAIILAGRGSVMDKFDQKPIKFEQYLATVNRLTQPGDELTTMLSKVCRLPDTQGLRNSADYHKIIELSDGYLDTEQRDRLLHYLQAMQQNQVVDPQGLAHGFLKLLAGRCGMSAAEMEGIPDVHFNAWNIPYVHLIPSALRQLPPHNQQQLMNIFKSTLKGRFPELLADTETDVGKANQETRAAFAYENLNFETWLNYDQKLAFNNDQKPLELQLWRRQPGHDLFQGSYAQSCVALDSSKGKAIVEALLHQCVQMLEVREQDTAKPIGKVLLYWAKDLLRQEPVLVADNVQFQGAYQNMLQMREPIRRWLADYGQAVAGKPVTVLLGSRYNRIPTKDLESRSYNLKVLGDTESHEFYLNSLGTGWSDLRKTHPIPMFRLFKA